MSAMTRDRLSEQIVDYVNKTLERGPERITCAYVDGDNTLVDNGADHISFPTSQTEAFVDEVGRLKTVSQSSACMDPDRPLDRQFAALDDILVALAV